MVVDSTGPVVTHENVDGPLDLFLNKINVLELPLTVHQKTDKYLKCERKKKFNL